MTGKPNIVSLGRTLALTREQNVKQLAAHLRHLAGQLEDGTLGAEAPDALLIVGAYRSHSGVLLEAYDPTGLLHPLTLRGALITAIDQTYEPPVPLPGPECDHD